MAGITLPNYPAFNPSEDPTDAQGWSDWLEGFEALIRALQIANQVKEDKDKYALLYHYIGQPVRSILKKLENNGIEDEDYKAATTALDTHFKPKMNRVYLMHLLHQCKQKQDESMDTFYMRVKVTMEPLELSKLTVAELIELITLSQLVNNTSNNSLRKKALKDGLSLKHFIDCARAHERADMQSKEIEKAEVSTYSIGAHSSCKGGRSERDKSQSRQKKCFTCNGPYPHKDKKCPMDNKRAKECYYCGGSYPHRGRCPATDSTCKKCGKRGHFDKMCKSSNVDEVKGNSDDDTDEYDIPSVVGSVTSDKRRRKTELLIGEKTLTCVLDSGAMWSVISETMVKKLGLTIDTSRKRSLFGYCKRKLNILGTVTVRVRSEITQAEMEVEFQVVEGDEETLLGCLESETLRLINFAHSVKEKTKNMETLMKEYQDVFKGIGKMKDTKINLHINHDITPIKQKVRRVPFHLRQKLEEELIRLKEEDIIEEATGPTDWISPILVRPKSGDKVRVCLDSRAINTAIMREKQVMPTLDDLKHDLNGAKVFSTVDLNKGYHQLELEENSRPITTFITHKGLYRYKRLCFGINSAAEIFQKKIEEMLQGIEGVKNMSDDIIIYAESEEAHHRILEKVLARLRENNITVNPQKCRFNKASVTYFGHNFSAKGIRPTEERKKTIMEVDAPKTASEVRSLLGMAQYISHFIRNFSDTVAPLRKLTQKKTAFKWGKTEEEAFKTLKTAIGKASTVEFFDTNQPTELIVDASPTGLGAILTQRRPDNSTKIVEFASRPLTETEQKYSQTEREMLGLVWGCEHFNIYLYGSEFTALTDHKPLLGIIKHTSKSTARLERLTLRLQPYKFKLLYKPGGDNEADFLSRHPTMQKKKEHLPKLDQEIDQICSVNMEEYMVDGVSIEEVRQETQQDALMMEVMKMIMGEKPGRKEQELWSFKLIKDELSINNGLLLRGDRIVIPRRLQKKIIRIAHRSHQGIVKTKALLRETVWFPGIDRQVEQAVQECILCQAATRSKSTQAPLKMTILPDGPWEELSADFHGPLSTGDYLLVVIDDYSRFPEVEVVASLNAKTVIPKFDAIFARHGIPKIVKTDNGPPFNGELFTKWGKSIGFHHKKITPLWPQSNGEAERMMDTLGKLIRVCHQEKSSWKQHLFKFLRHYRATPHSTTGISPAEMLYSRKIRTDIPSMKKSVRFQDTVAKAEQRDERMKSYMKELADRSRRDVDIKIDDKVLVKQRQTSKEQPYFRQEPYRVTKMNGTMITAANTKLNQEVTRNISHFKKVPENCEDDETSHEETAPKETTEEQSETPRRSERARKPPEYLKDYVSV